MLRCPCFRPRLSYPLTGIVLADVCTPSLRAPPLNKRTKRSNRRSHWQLLVCFPRPRLAHPRAGYHHDAPHRQAETARCPTYDAAAIIRWMSCVLRRARCLHRAKTNPARDGAEHGYGSSDRGTTPTTALYLRWLMWATTTSAGGPLGDVISLSLDHACVFGAQQDPDPCNVLVDATLCSKLDIHHPAPAPHLPPVHERFSTERAYTVSRRFDLPPRPSPRAQRTRVLRLHWLAP